MAEGKNKRVIVGLSGGVDSAVTAYVLKEQGYDVIGVTMQTGSVDETDAKKVAETLGIEFHLVDYSKEFNDTIKDYFVSEYLRGRTPNPCVICNPKIKFKMLLNAKEEFSADYIATGHYAIVEKLPNGRYALKNCDNGKDQTYALYGLTQEELECLVLPLGQIVKSKEEVRDLAKKAGIPVADKPDSMENCFIPDNDYAKFIEEYTGEKKPEGNFVDREGNILGTHKGITYYTVGQRKGLGIAFGKPMYVVELRPETNEVVLGEDLSNMKDELTASDVSWMGGSDLDFPKEGLIAKVRYAHKGQACELSVLAGNRINIRFTEKVRAITPGQSVVVYDRDGHIICGGIID